ncbi:MAG TPA: hypothetical protein VLB84_06510 [Bacteroidia bacterium]|nr:hypothetical protein [Bacteroidia bacterium]
MKLHLGCGQRYFEGYTNIDYPLSEHSVQQTTIADEYANLLELRYQPGTIDEVRLHHVFEHFSRATALALLYSWNTWLKKNATLRIEVPDFEKTGKVALSRFSSKKAKAVAMRHIFGSQEAHWAVHFEGYTPSSLRAVIELYGFRVLEIKKNSHMGTYNIDVIATKVKDLSFTEAKTITRNYLNGYLVADVESERLMLDIWMNDFEKQVKNTTSLP